MANKIISNLTFDNHEDLTRVNNRRLKVNYSGDTYYLGKKQEVVNGNYVDDTLPVKLIGSNIKGYCEKVANGYYKKVDGSSEVVKSENLFNYNITPIYFANSNVKFEVVSNGFKLSSLNNATYMFVCWVIGKTSDLIGKTIYTKANMVSSAGNGRVDIISGNATMTTRHALTDVNISSANKSYAITNAITDEYIGIRVYANQSQGGANSTFTNFIVSTKDIPYTPYFEPRIINKGSILPSEYQQVEYIESSGSQYINTNFYPTPNSCIEANISACVSTTQRRFFGVSYGNDSCIGLALYTNGSGKYAWAWNDTQGNFKAFGSNVSVIPNEKHYIKLDSKNNVAMLDSHSENMNTTRTKTSQRPLLINAWWQSSNLNVAVEFHSARYYNLKITDNGVVVRDYIPCYRKSDNVVGLYDMVSKQFYTNSGSGSFVAGAIYQEGFGYDYYVDDVNVGKEALRQNCYADSSGVRVDGRVVLKLDRYLPFWWEVIKNGTEYIAVYNNNGALVSWINSISNYYENAFSSVWGNESRDKYTITLRDSGQIRIDINITNLGITNSDDWLTYCDNHNITIEYETINTTTSLIPMKTYQSGNTQAYKMYYPYVSDISVSGNGYNSTSTINMPILADVVGNHYESEYTILDLGTITFIRRESTTSGVYYFYGSGGEACGSTSDVFIENFYSLAASGSIGNGTANNLSLALMRSSKGIFLIRDDRFETVEMFKQYLQQNNVKIKYKLATKQVLDLDMPIAPYMSQVKIEYTGNNLPEDLKIIYWGAK